MSERAVRLVVTGRVQGVGFRDFVAGEAQGCGARGWVRNRRDRTVEAVVAGPPDIVDAVIAACRCGPPASRVDDVAVEDVSEDDPAAPRDATFLVLPTV